MTTLYWVLENRFSKFDKSIYHFRSTSLYEKLTEKDFLKQVFPACFSKPENEDIVSSFLSDWVGLNLNRHLLHESFISTDNTLAMKINQGINIIKMKYDPEIAKKMMLGAHESVSTNKDSSTSSTLYKSTTLPVERTTYEDIDFSDEMTKTENNGGNSSDSNTISYTYDTLVQERVNSLYENFVKEIDRAVFSQFLF